MRSTNRLTATQVKNARAGERDIKLSDGGGMFLLVNTKGGKGWRLSYRFGGKQKMISLGVYPEVPLKDAREARDAARRVLAEGRDPSNERQIKKANLAEDSFEAVARDWLSKRRSTWSAGYYKDTVARIENNLLPWLGARPINQITAPELLTCLRRIESRGAHDLSHRCHQLSGEVFRYAVAIGKAERDPSQDIRGALTTRSPIHFASITDPQGIGELLRAIDGYRGDNTTRIALQMAPYVFLRPGELRQAEWSEFNLDAAEWRIPAEKMKLPTPHIIPLAPQVIALLEDLRPLTGSDRYLFSSLRTKDRPMSENTLNAALRRMGYDKSTMTSHGFRSMASTRLNEMGWPSDWIERQLSHVERNAVRASYNYAQHLPERRRMMLAWANYLDDLRASNLATDAGRYTNGN
ncbi:MAG: tyrosine-type recombinase/integrase [Chromatiaceae bacterium]|nr:tyrosine-type recombinase/integrase [Chromatiaceae bacterium]